MSLIMGTFGAVLFIPFAQAFFMLTHRVAWATVRERYANFALAMRNGGFLLGAVLAFSGIARLTNPLDFLLSIVIALVFLFVAGKVSDILIIYQVDNDAAVIGENNAWIALTEAASYVGTGFILGSAGSWNDGILSMVPWFLLGQLLMLATGRFLFRDSEAHTQPSLLIYGSIAIACSGFILAGAISGPSSGMLVLDVGLSLAWFLGWVLISLLLVWLTSLAFGFPAVTESRYTAIMLSSVLVCVTLLYDSVGQALIGGIFEAAT